MTVPVTAAMLYDLVSCPHRVTMDLFGEPIPGSIPGQKQHRHAACLWPFHNVTPEHSP